MTIYHDDANRDAVIQGLSKHASISALTVGLENAVKDYAETQRNINSLDKALADYIKSVDYPVCDVAVPAVKDRLEHLKEANRELLTVIDSLAVMLQKIFVSPVKANYDSLPDYTVDKYPKYLGSLYCRIEKCPSCLYRWICEAEASFNLTKQVDAALSCASEALNKPSAAVEDRPLWTRADTIRFNQVLNELEEHINGTWKPETAESKQSLVSKQGLTAGKYNMKKKEWEIS